MTEKRRGDVFNLQISQLLLSKEIRLIQKLIQYGFMLISKQGIKGKQPHIILVLLCFYFFITHTTLTRKHDKFISRMLSVKVFAIYRVITTHVKRINASMK